MSVNKMTCFVSFDALSSLFLPPPQSVAGTARLNALGLQVLAMQASSRKVLPERVVRERLGNNPDTSKALRRWMMAWWDPLSGDYLSPSHVSSCDQCFVEKTSSSNKIIQMHIPYGMIPLLNTVISALLL